LLDIISTVIILIAVGLGAGTLGSMLGVGGGIIMVPALTFLGVPPVQAAATSLFAVTSTSVSSTVAYSRQKRIDYRRGVELAVAAIPGAVIGPFILGQIAPADFNLYFGILLIAVGLYIAFRSSILKEKPQGKVSPATHAAVFAMAFGAGIISSFFGVGGGVVFVPVMLLIYGMSMRNAAPTSQLTLMLTSFAGLFTHVALGNPDYLYAIALSAGAVVGAQLGARWSKNAREALLQKMLGIALIAVAIRLFAEWLGSR
jgi:uncharacterized membrane protein YfcA